MPSDFENQCLARHNELRAKHGVAPLKLNSEMSARAQKWADHINKAGALSHCQDRSFNGSTMGENIAMIGDGSCTDYTGEMVTDQWYTEIENFDFSKSRKKGTAPIGHFTQVVWKNSKELGVGRATDGKGKWYAVANYLPPGNFNNMYAENVFALNSGDNSQPDPEPAPAANGGGSCDMQKQMDKMSLKDLPSVDHGDKQVVGTSTSRQMKSSRSNGKTTKTTITTTTYKYSDGTSRVETKEDVETS